MTTLAGMFWGGGGHESGDTDVCILRGGGGGGWGRGCHGPVRFTACMLALCHPCVPFTSAFLRQVQPTANEQNCSPELCGGFFG